MEKQIKISKESLERLSRIGYGKIQISNGVPQVYRTVNGERERRAVSHVLMDLLPNDKRIVLYKDGDKMNLYLRNLIISTMAEAQQGKNKFVRVGGTSSQYIGVSWHRKAGKWKATIKPPNQPNLKHLGLHVEEKEAAKAYNEAAKLYHGTNARLNTID